MYYRNKGGNIFCPKFCPLLILKTNKKPTLTWGCLQIWERNINQLPPLYTPTNWGIQKQPRYVPWPRIQPAPLWCEGLHCNQLSHLARATFNTFLRNTTYFCIFKGITCLKKLAHTKQMITNVLVHKQHLIIGLTIWLHNLSYFLL